MRESGGTRRSRRGGRREELFCGGRGGWLRTGRALSSAVSAVSVPVLWQLCAFIDPSPGLCLLPRRRQKAAATSNTAVLDWRRDVVIARVGRAKVRKGARGIHVPILFRWYSSAHVIAGTGRSCVGDTEKRIERSERNPYIIFGKSSPGRLCSTLVFRKHSHEYAVVGCCPYLITGACI